MSFVPSQTNPDYTVFFSLSIWWEREQVQTVTQTTVNSNTCIIKISRNPSPPPILRAVYFTCLFQIPDNMVYIGSRYRIQGPHLLSDTLQSRVHQMACPKAGVQSVRRICRTRLSTVSATLLPHYGPGPRQERRKDIGQLVQIHGKSQTRSRVLFRCITLRRSRRQQQQPQLIV